MATRRNWPAIIEKLNSSPSGRMKINMGSPGSAQVTRCRLLEQWDGIEVTTSGSHALPEPGLRSLPARGASESAPRAARAGAARPRRAAARTRPIASPRASRAPRRRARAGCARCFGRAIALICALASACSPEAEDPRVAFWRSFATDARKLAWATGAPRDPATEQIAAALARVHPEIVFELRGEPGRARRLLLSADGRATVAPEVEALAAVLAADASLAPAGWEVVAFRPREGTDHAIDFRGFVLEPDAVWFEAQPEGSAKLALSLYVAGIGEAEDALAREAARLMLHSAIGERSAIEGLVRVRYFALPPDPGARDLKPLWMLPTIVDTTAAPAEG